MADYFDTLSEAIRNEYNRDGTLKNRNELIANGRQDIVDRLEYDFKQELIDGAEVDRQWLKKRGIKHSDWRLEQDRKNAEHNRKFPDRQRLAIENGEDLDSLPKYMDQDDYYDEIDF